MAVRAIETTEAPGRLRPIDPARDLRSIADLIAEAFAGEIDERGRAALRELRWMARLSPLVWWWAQADPTFHESFNGFVWEVPGVRRGRRQVVGNVSLSRAPGSHERWVIANVVVAPEHRNLGIGGQLVEAAVEHARELGAVEVVLQVYEDNAPAMRLYIDRGFCTATGEVHLRLEGVQPVAYLDASGYHVRGWQPDDGRATLELARQARPLPLQWLRPLRPSDYRRDWLTRLGERLADLWHGRRTYRLVALQDEQLAAMLTVKASFRRDVHRLDLLLHPRHLGQVEATLVSRGLHMLAAVPPRPVQTTLYPEQQAALEVVRDYGFQKQRTLLTLRRSL